jgi:hypothetical protein
LPGGDVAAILGARIEVVAVARRGATELNGFKTAGPEIETLQNIADRVGTRLRGDAVVVAPAAVRDGQVDANPVIGAAFNETVVRRAGVAVVAISGGGAAFFEWSEATGSPALAGRDIAKILRAWIEVVAVGDAGAAAFNERVRARAAGLVRWNEALIDCAGVAIVAVRTLDTARVDPNCKANARGSTPGWFTWSEIKLRTVATYIAPQATMLVSRRVDTFARRAAPIRAAQHVANTVTFHTALARGANQAGVDTGPERCAFEELAGINGAGIAIVALDTEDTAAFDRLMPAYASSRVSVDFAGVSGAGVGVQAVAVLLATAFDRRVDTCTGIIAGIERARIAVVAVLAGCAGQTAGINGWRFDAFGALAASIGTGDLVALHDLTLTVDAQFFLGADVTDNPVPAAGSVRGSGLALGSLAAPGTAALGVANAYATLAPLSDAAASGAEIADAGAFQGQHDANPDEAGVVVLAIAILLAAAFDRRGPAESGELALRDDTFVKRTRILVGAILVRYATVVTLNPEARPGLRAGRNEAETLLTQVGRGAIAVLGATASTRVKHAHAGKLALSTIAAIGRAKVTIVAVAVDLATSLDQEIAALAAHITGVDQALVRGTGIAVDALGGGGAASCPPLERARAR